jgi:hypothetical protein
MLIDPSKLEREIPLRIKQLTAADVLALLASEGLDQREDWAPFLEKIDSTPDHPLDPVLVRRLDHPESFYYIYLLQTRGPDRTAPIAVIVDALTGDYLQATTAPQPDKNVPIHIPTFDEAK